MNKAYKVRIYPNAEQTVLMEKTFGCARFVFNQTLNIRKTAYRQFGVSLSGYDCVKALPEMKEMFPWLREVDSTALQSSAMDVDSAFNNFFQHRGKYPKFKHSVSCPAHGSGG